MYKIWTTNDAFSNAAVDKLYATGEEVQVVTVNYLNLVDYITETGGGQLPVIYRDGVLIGGYDALVIYLNTPIAPVEPTDAPVEPSVDEVVSPYVETISAPTEAPNG